jgi:hypothetical protein
MRLSWRDLPERSICEPVRMIFEALGLLQFGWKLRMAAQNMCGYSERFRSGRNLSGSECCWRISDCGMVFGECEGNQAPSNAPLSGAEIHGRSSSLGESKPLVSEGAPLAAPGWYPACTEEAEPGSPGVVSPIGFRAPQAAQPPTPGASPTSEVVSDARGHATVPHPANDPERRR